MPVFLRAPIGRYDRTVIWSRAPFLLTSVASLVLSAAVLQAAPPAVAAGLPDGSGSSSPTVSPAASADDAVNQVLAISVDGLNPRAIKRLGRSGAPAFHRLMREGAWTFNARTEWGQTRT